MYDGTNLPAGVDVIVRLHDVKRLLEFGYALFSLSNQTYGPIHVIVVTQSFDADMTDQVRASIAAYCWRERGHPEPSVVNVSAPPGADIRTKLLNVGIGHARYRFLAFLDCDDYLYGHAYEYLVNEAMTSGAVLTFGGIVCRHIKVFEQFVYSVKEFRDLFRGEGLRDLHRGNFCPIHSFLVDREQIAPSDLAFNPALNRLEDYEFLLRVCTKYKARFESRAKVVGVYNWHLDGRGSIQFAEVDATKTAENKRSWNNARRHIWRLKTLLRGDQAVAAELITSSASQTEAVSPEAVSVGAGSGDLPLLVPLGHFYSPVADPKEIRKREARLWSASDVLEGVDLAADKQIDLLAKLKPHAVSIDYPVDDPGDNRTYFYNNDQYPVLDAEFLHAALSYFRPKAMIEVGSGFSSLVTANVNRTLLGGKLHFTCIEPYPRQFLVDGVEGISRVVQQKVEDADPALFDVLGPGDVLFIDSSHVSKTGSDVNYLLFDVLPRLKPGVLIHFHDIFLPDEYPKEWVLEQGRNWNEQYLIRAFLQYNRSFKVVWAAHFMGTRNRAAVQTVFPNYPALGGGGSLWIRREG